MPLSGRRLGVTWLPTILLVLAGVPTLALEVTRGPFLQSATEDSVVIRWNTDEPADSRVVYGPRVDTLASSVESFVLTTDHSLTLDGLKAGTRHYYAVGTTGGLLVDADNEQFFVTSPPKGSAIPTRIWVLGDSGQGGATSAAVRDAYHAYTNGARTDVWLMLGDNAYPTGTEENYQAKLFDVYPATLRTSPLWPTIGNHEYDPSTGSFPYLEIFTLPENGEAGGVPSGTESYYSFDHANIHFVALDSTTYPWGNLLQSPMLPWLEADLAANAQRWIIAYFHHPPYTKGSHNSDNPNDSNGRLVDMRELVVPILEDHGVDLVLAGHSHSYERSYLIHGHYEDSTTLVESMIIDHGDGAEGGDGPYEADGDGTVYAVAGSSSLTSGGPFEHPAMHTWANELGSVVLDVAGNRLDAMFLDSAGVILDEYTLLKGDCDHDGLCESGEDCHICPDDCGFVEGASCGNGICEVLIGEDCLSCADDCRGRQVGIPDQRFCCGDGAGENPVSSTDPRCSTDGFWITDLPASPACCGDSVCSGAEGGPGCELDCPTPAVCGDGSCDEGENPCACAADCGSPPANEIPGSTCEDGSDNDCDGAADESDPDCGVCLPRGDACSDDAECCSAKCKGKAGSRSCK
jgi:hypothetical protein